MQALHRSRSNRQKREMSKLWKLREWLTLAEAGRVLSSLVGEPVAEAEILRLAIDDQLTLSVHFAHGVHARQWVAVDLATVKWVESPALGSDGVDRFPENGTIRCHADYPPMQLIGPVIFGQPAVFDLPMIGSGPLLVERHYQRLNGGTEPAAMTIDGVTIRSTSGTLFEVQVSREDSDSGEPEHNQTPFG
jgi:hypothetical protein